MGTVTMVGSMRCRDGEDAQLEAVLGRMVDAARDEPGVEVYSYHRGEGGTYWFFALMADEAAVQAHGHTAAMQAAMAEAMPLLAAPPDVHTATPLEAVGLSAG